MRLKMRNLGINVTVSNHFSDRLLISELNSIQSVDIPDFKTENLNQLLFNPDRQGTIKGGWVGNYVS